MENAQRPGRPQNPRNDGDMRDAARREEHLAREAARKEERTFRETMRQEDLAFRQHSHEIEHQARREAAQAATRRSALESAALLCGRDTPVEKVLTIAAEFEAWLNQPDTAQ